MRPGRIETVLLHAPDGVVVAEVSGGRDSLRVSVAHSEYSTIWWRVVGMEGAKRIEVPQGTTRDTRDSVAIYGPVGGVSPSPAALVFEAWIDADGLKYMQHKEHYAVRRERRIG